MRTPSLRGSEAETQILGSRGDRPRRRGGRGARLDRRTRRRLAEAPRPRGLAAHPGHASSLLLAGGDRLVLRRRTGLAGHRSPQSIEGKTPAEARRSSSSSASRVSDRSRQRSTPPPSRSARSLRPIRRSAQPVAKGDDRAAADLDRPEADPVRAVIARACRSPTPRPRSRPHRGPSPTPIVQFDADVAEGHRRSTCSAPTATTQHPGDRDLRRAAGADPRRLGGRGARRRRARPRRRDRRSSAAVDLTRVAGQRGVQRHDRRGRRSSRSSSTRVRCCIRATPCCCRSRAGRRPSTSPTSSGWTWARREGEARRARDQVRLQPGRRPRARAS